MQNKPAERTPNLQYKAGDVVLVPCRVLSSYEEGADDFTYDKKTKRRVLTQENPRVEMVQLQPVADGQPVLAMPARLVMPGTAQPVYADPRIRPNLRP